MKQNLFQNLPDEIPEELFEEIESGKSFRLERIVSDGHKSSPGFWYDQPQQEWVILLQGAARIELESPEDDVELQPGDYLLIPAGRRHRVAWTTSESKTVWLAIQFDK